MSPQRELPPLLMTSEQGSFAEHTILRRKPQVIADVIAHNDYPSVMVASLQALAREMAGEPIRPPTPQPGGLDAPSTEAWYRAWELWEGRTWRQVGWYFAEAFFYRRLMEAVRYFAPGPWYGVDPFASQKREALAQAPEAPAPLASSLLPGRHFHDDPLPDTFTHCLQRTLWGNRADLSNTLVSASADGETEDDRLLIDHTQAVWSLFASGQVRRLEWVCDNVGPELLADMRFLDLCLSEGLVETAAVHLKAWPFYVSDATMPDWVATVEALCAASTPPLRALGERLRTAQRDGRLALHAHPFWTSPLFFCELPDDLLAELGTADLLVFKGDANYRRLVQDRHWPYTIPMEDLTAYMPASLVAVRTLKSELVVGLAAGQAERAASQDPRWLINGERGVIHLCLPRATSRTGAA